MPHEDIVPVWLAWPEMGSFVPFYLRLLQNLTLKTRHAEKQKVCIDIWVVKPYIFWLVYDVFQVILDTLVGLAVFLGPVCIRHG